MTNVSPEYDLYRIWAETPSFYQQYYRFLSFCIVLSQKITAHVNPGWLLGLPY